MRRFTVIVIFLTLFYSCKHAGKNEQPLFSLLPSKVSGVTFTNTLTENSDNNIIQYLYFNNGAGVAAGDINNDGLVDLYFTANQEPNRLYLNKGNFTFEDITEKAGVAGTGDWKTGVTMADINGDGLTDIYVSQVGKYKKLNGKNQLFINNGDLTFTEKAHEYGLDFRGFSTQAAFFDYDLDGDLDMYLLNHSVHSSKSYGDYTLRYDFDSLAGDRLFRNDIVNGKRIFTDVTKESGIYSSQIGYGLSVSICDINDDGFPDIFVSNDFHENDYLYINNGHGSFTEKLTEMFGHTSRSSMGNDISDFNNDGMPDLMVLDMLPGNQKLRMSSAGEDDYDLYEVKLDFGYYYQYVRNTLQLNQGDGLFSEIGRLSGVYRTDWSWSPLFVDADNDGWKDLFITNGIFRRANDLDYLKYLSGEDRLLTGNDSRSVPDSELYLHMPLQPNVSYLFRNNGKLLFTDVTGKWGISKPSFSNGATYADLDNDGFEDLIVNNINDQAFIYRNNGKSITGNHYLKISFSGAKSNKNGTGARVTVINNGRTQMAEQFRNRGFMSSVSDKIIFGLGPDKKVDTLIVRWPGNAEQIITNIPADTSIVLSSEEATVTGTRSTLKRGYHIYFERDSLPGLNFTHKEDSYTDFRKEKLAPESLSGEGPAIAKADVNNDGLEDIFIGGSKGNFPFIFLQNRDGSFKRTGFNFMKQPLPADITDASFFDADGDKDMDLYLVSGGNELLTGSSALSDMLLINDGNGNYSLAPESSLPRLSHNGSCVRPCDYNGDGDMDLFIGSRSVPGSYGWPADQYILENNGHGIFKNVTQTVAPFLKASGMVTDAAWADIDKDGDKDLVIAGEWMKIMILRNDNGVFTDLTEKAGMSESSGLWTSLIAHDIDNDGDVDLIAGNTGLNSILKASPSEPVEMYLSDFDNNGTLDQVLCCYQDGISYPVASLDEISAQVTGISGKFRSYADFGGKTIKDIFGNNAVSRATVSKVQTMESCIFINDGKGSFTKKKLPLEAQFSPVRGIISEDLNKDGLNDLIIAGNNYYIRPSYGRYDASYGSLLLADNKNNYNALAPYISGLEIRGDARKILEITAAGKSYLIAAVNNGKLQVFRMKK